MYSIHELSANILYIGGGVGITLILLIPSLIAGSLLGIIITKLRLCRGIFGAVGKCYISILRGTPIILQLSIVYFTFPSITGIQIDSIVAGILTFSINSSAYIAEILRSGISSIPSGQIEAAKSLGASQFYIWRDIMAPQILRNIFPSIINECVSLLKETPLIAIIGGMDIMRISQILAAQKFTYFEPLCIAALYYYFIAFIIERLGSFIENRYFGLYKK